MVKAEGEVGWLTLIHCLFSRMLKLSLTNQLRTEGDGEHVLLALLFSESQVKLNVLFSKFHYTRFCTPFGVSRVMWERTSARTKRCGSLPV